MIPSEFHYRTLMIRHGDQVATAFAYDRNGRQYIVSARHVLEAFGEAATLGVMHDGVFKSLQARLVGHADNGIDVSVVAADDWAVKIPDEKFNNSAGVYYSQEVYFLGFPFGLYGNLGEIFNLFPHPFVKRAIVSSLGSPQAPMFLDGINNEGFSGGPVIARQPDGKLSIVGIISGYRARSRMVLHKGNDTGLAVDENTGLIAAHHIARAVELMDANPIGRPLS